MAVNEHGVHSLAGSLDDISHQDVSSLDQALCARMVSNNENAAPIPVGEILVVWLRTNLDPPGCLLRHQLLQ